MIGVMSKQRPAPHGGVEQLPRIGRAFAPLLVSRYDVMPSIDKETREPQGHILIKIERCHLRGAARGKAGVNRCRVLPIIRDRRIHRFP